MTNKEYALIDLKKLESATLELARLDTERRSPKDHELFALYEDSMQHHFVGLTANCPDLDVSGVRKYVRLAHATAFYYEHCLALMKANTYCSQWLFNEVSAQAKRQQALCLRARDRIVEIINLLS